MPAATTARAFASSAPTLRTRMSASLANRATRQRIALVPGVGPPHVRLGSVAAREHGVLGADLHRRHPVGIPSAIKVFNWVATLYKGDIRLKTPMLYALSCLLLFTIGGLTGLFLGIGICS